MSAPGLDVLIKRLEGNEDVRLPHYKTRGAAGMDICAAVREDVVIPPGERALIPAGFAMALPEGYEAQVRPRSGLALKEGITVLNSPGTIDSDYRGEVAVILANLGSNPFRIKRGDRIAQMVISAVTRTYWVETDDLSATERGDGGFGSTDETD